MFALSAGDDGITRTEAAAVPGQDLQQTLARFAQMGGQRLGSRPQP